MLLRAQLLSAGKLGLNSRNEENGFGFIIILPQKKSLGTNPSGKTEMNLVGNVTFFKKSRDVFKLEIFLKDISFRNQNFGGFHFK